MKRLDGRVAVVTGAASGIGRATCEALAARGCRVALVDRDEGGLVAAERSIPTESSTHVVDVTDESAVAALPAAVLEAHGSCHILVNNAGVTTAGRFDEDDLEVVRWVIDINLWGVLNGCHAFLPFLREADEAHIVNLSSMVGLLGFPQGVGYAASKGGVRSASESLRAELRGSSVGVTAVFPGSIRTNIMHAARGAESERLSSWASSRFAPLVLRPPESVAKGIVRGIERDRARIVVGFDAHFVDLWTKFVPGRSGLIGRLADVVSS